LQPQTPFDRHTWPVMELAQSAHALPLAPQALLAVPGMHVPPAQQPLEHGFDAEHGLTQALLWQTSPAGQVWAQEPQLAASLVRSTQAPPQVVRSPGHLQTPLTQR
jgi:hypothetical protein